MVSERFSTVFLPSEPPKGTADQVSRSLNVFPNLEKRGEPRWELFRPLNYEKPLLAFSPDGEPSAAVRRKNGTDCHRRAHHCGLREGIEAEGRDATLRPGSREPDRL
jgi:hypothetical protein